MTELHYYLEMFAKIYIGVGRGHDFLKIFAVIMSVHNMYAFNHIENEATTSAKPTFPFDEVAHLPMRGGGHNSAQNDSICSSRDSSQVADDFLGLGIIIHELV